MNQVAQILGVTRHTNVCDVGALPIDGEPVYRGMENAGLCRVTAIEPQWERVGTAAGHCIDRVVYDGTPQTLNLCHAPGMTSLLTPNPHVLAAFGGFETFGRVLGTRRCETATLDQLGIVPDMIVADVQGSELTVLGAAPAALAAAVAVQVEVSFIPLYANQPSISDVDLFMRNSGFLPHSMVALKRWPMTPMVGLATDQANQLLEADIVYLRDHVRGLSNLSTDALRQMAIIVHCCYRSYDVVARIIVELQRRGVLSEHVDQAYVEIVRAEKRQALRSW